MTLRTRKYFKLIISLILDLVVISGLAYALWFLYGFANRLVVHLVVAAVLSIVIVLSETDAYSKLFSSVIVLSLPYFGVAIYLFLYLERVYVGIFLKKKKSKRNPFDKALKKLENELPDYAKVAKYVDYSTNFPPLFAENVTYFSARADYFESILSSIKKAEKCIFLEFYIVRQGLFFSRLMTELFGALKRGVRVELTVDYFGSGKFDITGAARELKLAGARVKVFKPPLAFLGWNFNFRTHRKIVVIDSKVGYIGGINCHDDENIKDSGLMLVGDAAKQLENMIYRLDGRAPNYNYNGVDSGLGYIQPFSVSGSKIMENIYKGILSTAKKEVLISSPYFCYSDDIKNALYYLLDTGVKVKVLLPENDSRAVRLVNLHYAMMLKNRGAEIFFYGDGFLHEKMFVVDGKIALCGSSNFDLRSQKYQIEGGLLIYDNRVIDELLMDFSLLVAKSKRAETVDMKLNVISKAYQSFLRLFSYFI